MVKGIVRELTHRHYVSNLMKRSNDQTRYGARRSCQARCRDSFDFGSIPTIVAVVDKRAERDTLRAQPHATAPRGPVTLGLKIRGYLAGQHFDEARPIHPDRLSFVKSGFRGDEVAKFIHAGRGRNRVCVIEIEKIKALAEHEDFAHPITAGPDKGCVVAAGAHQIRSRDLKFPTVLEMHGNSYLLTNKASRLSPRRGHNGH